MALTLPDGDTLTLRQIHRLAEGGAPSSTTAIANIPVLTSRTDLPATAVCWRQENYFTYAREHFALEGLDSYAAIADDLAQLVPNPANTQRRAAVETARAALYGAENRLSTAVDEVTARARQPGSGGSAEIDPAATRARSRATPAPLPWASSALTPP